MDVSIECKPSLPLMKLFHEPVQQRRNGKTFRHSELLMLSLLRTAAFIVVPFLVVVFLWEENTLNHGLFEKHNGKGHSSVFQTNLKSHGKDFSSTDDESQMDLDMLVSSAERIGMMEESNEEVHLDGEKSAGDRFVEALEQIDGANKYERAQKLLISHSGDHGDDPVALMNRILIRPRPRNLRLVFIGDSLTRYQYLSLAYWLRYGRWFDPSVYPNNLLNAHSFHHDYHPNDDWNEFFIQSNRILQPFELCDCSRQERKHIAVERRYFHESTRNNTLVYINVSGESTLGHKGLYGRVDPRRVFEAHGGLSRSGLIADHEREDEWEYRNWGDLVRYHVGALRLGPSAVVILNAGLHPNRFHDSLRTASLRMALEGVSLKGIWKTTTFRKDQLVQTNMASDATQVVAMSTIDNEMCGLMDDCFDLTWMAHINPDMYYDNLHFNEPVYRILNEELLARLELLPRDYEQLERSMVLKKQ